MLGLMKGGWSTYEATPAEVSPSGRSERHSLRVTRRTVVSQQCMRKTLSLVGSVALSSLFGMAGARIGIMTGFVLGMIGTGLGMYAGYRIAARLGL